ncbi:C40 family peptidase [Saccharomonospora iraqiensis]|uniref:C40 family peptidase n=1 Tax=Saccharomonospora iraqiensis TaxID=52698 RepID=UPI00022E0B20|nr:C40 family peptidase [Saccharomonospora iraqiensis]
MRSHPVKRLAPGTLAACAVLAGVTFAQAPATALPVPAPQQPVQQPLQQPPSGSEELEEYRELSSKAEKLNEKYLQAQEDLKAKEDELDELSTRLTEAEEAEKQARADEERFRVDVDRFAGTTFTSGNSLNRMSALITEDSAAGFLERSSAIGVLATDKNRALSRLRDAVQRAEDAKNQAAEAREQAEKARDKAERIAADLEARKKELDDQIAELEQQASLLSSSDVAAQQDIGPDPGPIQAPGPAAQGAIDAAMAKRGSPYVWGATGPSEFDCSGLTQWAYNQAGVSIPRTSRSQSQYGTPVSRSQLQPGDLVFFYSPVSHVGIYIGNGQMVHAPTSGDVVKVSPLQDQFSGARRVA